jgi:hypothetical protein
MLTRKRRYDAKASEADAVPWKVERLSPSFVDGDREALAKSLAHGRYLTSLPQPPRF